MTPELKKKVVLIVMDGVGISPIDKEAGDAFKAANTPTLDRLRADYPWIMLRAHGEAVGLPSDDDLAIPRSATMRWVADKFTHKAPNS